MRGLKPLALAGRNTPTEIIGLEEKFYNAVASIPKQPLDICMFPVDPNIGTMFEAGANHAIMALKPRLFLPMHFGKHGEMVKNYARTMKFRGTEIYALIQPRETIHVDFTDATIAINKVSQGLESEKKLDSRYNLSAYVRITLRIRICRWISAELPKVSCDTLGESFFCRKRGSIFLRATFGHT